MKMTKKISFFMKQIEKEEDEFHSGWPTRHQFCALYDEYLNEISPLNDDRLGYSSTLKLVRQYFYGVTYNSITRAVRYCSPHYKASFDDYLKILSIFFEKAKQVKKSHEKSISNVLNLSNNNNELRSEIENYIFQLRMKAKDKTIFDELPIIKSLNKFLSGDSKEKNADKIQSIQKNIKNSVKRIPAPLVNSELKDDSELKIKLQIHLHDLFASKDGIHYVQNSAIVTKGYAIECLFDNTCKYSRICLDDPNCKYFKIDEKMNFEAKIVLNSEDIMQKPKGEEDLNYYYTQLFFDKLHSVHLVLKVYRIFIKPSLQPIKFLLGYSKVPIIPVLLSAKHEVSLSTNFIWLTDINQAENKDQKENKNNDLISLTFSIYCEDDPIVKYSYPIDCFNEKYNEYRKTKLSESFGKIYDDLSNFYRQSFFSNNNEFQITAEDETGKIQFLCQFVNSNVDYDIENADELYKILIQEARKPGNESTIIRSPSSIYYNPTKMSQLERCIYLCNYLTKSVCSVQDTNNDEMYYVCCGDVHFERYYCVISIASNTSNNKQEKNSFKYSILMPGHTFPISLMTYIVDNKSTLDESLNIEVGQKYLDQEKKLKVWCLSEVYDDVVPETFKISTVFNHENVWINCQKENTIFKMNWDIRLSQASWKPVFDSNIQHPYAYSQRKIYFESHFDPEDYINSFKEELEIYKSGFSHENYQKMEILHNNLEKNQVVISDDCFLFYRDIEINHFMEPEELLNELIENHGLRESCYPVFDISKIEFRPMPLENCQINIRIHYLDFQI
ncbi:hypothetical protein TRFO_11486 [Tritrichomonas foetus]|uniref:Uncharacterized protein n=1 Tax=Tritrichomonas foetus TaxID=1144522 RepID=A0A1J4J5R9_9EUKA|nr:hypothetical protein TRFO_11486 [Tritrichomonas foetus]|eukprot:OHS93993.1 hypothetical protein TRFO_11486 [Tritrichomonas foetus]